MTITRLGQLTAELNTLQDLALIGNNLPSISSTKKKTGTYAYRTGDCPFGLALPSSIGVGIRCGFWVNHAGGQSTYSPTLLSAPLGGARISVVVGFTGNAVYLIGGKGINSVNDLYWDSQHIGGLANLDTWRHVGFTYLCSDTVGYCTVYLDGQAILHYAGDTRIYRSQYGTKEAVQPVSGMYIGGTFNALNWANYAYFDDFYVDDITGEADTPPPGKRFLVSLADGAGQNAQWTPSASTNISNVDDPLSSINDGDATYNKAASSGLKDTFNTAAITVPDGHYVRAAIPVVIAKKTDTVDSQIKLHEYDGANYTNGSAQFIPMSYAPVWERFPLAPDGSAWDATKFNASQFGVESAGSYS